MNCRVIVKLLDTYDSPKTNFYAIIVGGNTKYERISEKECAVHRSSHGDVIRKLAYEYAESLGYKNIVLEER